MNITTRNQNNVYGLPRKTNDYRVREVSSQNRNNVAFGTSVTKIVNEKTIYKGAQALIDGIDESLGKGYFKSVIDKAGKRISFDGENLIHDNRTFIGDLSDTFKAAFDIPLKISYSALKKLGVKFSPDSSIGKWATKNEQLKYYNAALDILEEYSSKGIKDNVIDNDKCRKIFQNTIGSNITKTKKNYESRDERALNRIATATVSALYSANDFYNISMLQKDDKEEAKKAHKGRLKQELKRVGLSAALTFLTLGALDRYTKKNIWLNASVIAGSTLISEIISRLTSGTPLKPLSPEEAQKISQIVQQRKAQKNSPLKDVPENKNVTFKSNLKDEKEIFKQFVKADGTFASGTVLKANANEAVIKDVPKEKKKSKLLNAFLGLFALSNFIYLAKKGFKGEINIHKSKMALCEMYNAKGEISDEIINAFKGINENIKKGEKFDIADKIEDILTKRKVKVDTKKLQDAIEELRKADEKGEITGVLDIYNEHIKKLGAESFEKETSIPVISGLYSGITKIFQTIYTILSAPAALVTGVVNKNVDKNYKETEELYEYIKSQIKPNHKKELTELGRILDVNEEHGIFKTVKNASNWINNKLVELKLIKPKTPADTIDLIKKRVRNVEIGAETSELANISRTMVTAITTYFFVNDYRNKVLLESGGKDVDGAKEEMNERLMHKLSNFIINGTLMNTFNTIFKVPLNKSLLSAAMVASATETTNEFLVRKSICQPIGKKNSKQEIIDYEEAQLNKKGFMGWWARTFKKLTGKKTLTQKAGIKSKKLDAHQG